MKKIETIFRNILFFFKKEIFFYLFIYKIFFVTLEIHNYIFYNEVKICLYTRHNIYR